ncbi:autotransporter outer membrane beta-barrel domain-containing protein [Pseudomonas mucidolens]|uniref:autotransporter outer membrane beta-barrel domain-containing protein n=1 Tax=Pseudomonas mucidolens TaxID=46679 RepID=UPI0030D999E1
MSLVQKQLALTITLAMGTIGAQGAHAHGNLDSAPGWLNQTLVEQQRPPIDAGIATPALPKPRGSSFAAHATSRNGLSVARVLDSVGSDPSTPRHLNQWASNPAFAERYRYGLAPGRLGALLEQLAGSQNANLGSATQNSLQQVNSGLLSALRQVDNTTSENSRVWFKGLGNTGTLDAQHGSAGVQQRSQGLLLGADWSLDHAWRIGVMGGKSTSDLNAKRFKGDLDSWHLGGYAVRQDGPLALRLGAIYSSHAGQNQRDVDFAFVDYREHLKGTYKAQSQNAFAELGYQWDSGGLRAEPFASLGYQRYQRDRFQEKGGDSALNVGAQTQQNLSSSLGLRVTHDFTLDNQMVLTPHLSTRWKHLYGDVGSSVRQSFAWDQRDASRREFTVGGTSLDRDSLALHTGLDLALSTQHSVGLAYTGEFGSNSRSQGLSGQWTMTF